MGLLKFTKQYSATDDGSKVSGADLGVLETDIAAILNGGITNVNINTSAGIVESKLTFDTTAGHHHDGIDSRILSAGGQRGFIQGAQLEYVAADQVKAGSGVVEIAGSFYTRNSYSTTIDTDTATHWVEGASQRAINTWAYVYAYNDSGSTWDIKYWLQAPQYANTITDDSSVKIYRQNASVWYRCLGAVRMNATGTGNIEPFYQRGNKIIYDDCYSNTTVRVVNGVAQVAFTDVDCSAVVPKIATICSINWTGQDACTLYVRCNGSSATNGTLDVLGSNDAEIVEDIPLDASQIFEYKTGVKTATIYIKSYTLGIR